MIPESNSTKKGPESAVVLHVLDVILVEDLPPVMYPSVAFLECMNGCVVPFGFLTTVWASWVKVSFLSKNHPSVFSEVTVSSEHLEEVFGLVASETGYCFANVGGDLGDHSPSV